MKNLAQVIIFAMVACVSTAAFAQQSTQELLREIEARNRAAQLEMEQSLLRWQQMEADTARRHTEIERLRVETDRLHLWNKSQEAADRAREIAGRAERAAFEQADAARKAEETAEELRNEMERAEIRTKNNIYLGVLLLLAFGFVTFVIRKSRKGEIMQENQKFGVAAIIGSVLVIVFAIMISDGWEYRFDFLQNLITTLRIHMFLANEDSSDAYYIIDVPTKYVVLACICVAAYGLTTYLGITPVPRKKTLKTQGANTEVKL